MLISTSLEYFIANLSALISDLYSAILFVAIPMYSLYSSSFL